jgi:hypothetical protein
MCRRCFLPPACEIEQNVQSQSSGCDEHQDEHKIYITLGPYSVIPYIMCE